MPDLAPAVPSATILMLRDSPEGLEVFMVVRHHQIDFASGALVFPAARRTTPTSIPASMFTSTARWRQQT